MDIGTHSEFGRTVFIILKYMGPLYGQQLLAAKNRKGRVHIGEAVKHEHTKLGRELDTIDPVIFKIFGQSVKIAP